MGEAVDIPNIEGLKRIVVIGGGFAGFKFVRKINANLFQVVLIDKINYHQFQPLMYQVATAGLEPSSIAFPLRKAFKEHANFHFRTCRALNINASESIVETNIGKIHYDYLVIATGCDTNYFENNSLIDAVFGMKSISESILIRNRILLSLEQALNATSECELEKILNFVIVGGGPTGVELTGALSDIKKNILHKDYPELDLSKMNIHLIDSSTRLLSSMSEYASKKVLENFQKKGVIIHQNRAVVSYEDDCIKMDNGEEIYSQNVFWVAGVKANTINGLNNDVYMKGRLLVNEYNQVKGYENIYCIGDISLMINDQYPKGHPQVVQTALQMANNLAKNMNRVVKGNSKMKKFYYKDKGSLATISRNAAVADLGKLKFSGFIAWLLWLIIHMLYTTGLKNKIFVIINWAWNYFTYDTSLRLLILPKMSKIYKKLD
ncbi:MAG: NAD(P)/FAD-dependent oxidoreductase [Bacteroidales bacterium]|jgi:NADH dehydrogenase|nr:NAD(P)/FAD-dependent oxidoreductase [Bacteroidales bacterium]